MIYSILYSILCYINNFNCFINRNRINAAILQMTESGELARLESKWWFDECGYEAKVS